MRQIAVIASLFACLFVSRACYGQIVFSKTAPPDRPLDAIQKEVNFHVLVPTGAGLPQVRIGKVEFIPGTPGANDSDSYEEDGRSKVLHAPARFAVCITVSFSGGYLSVVEAGHMKGIPPYSALDYVANSGFFLGDEKIGTVETAGTTSGTDYFLEAYLPSMPTKFMVSTIQNVEANLR